MAASYIDIGVAQAQVRERVREASSRPDPNIHHRPAIPPRVIQCDRDQADGLIRSILAQLPDVPPE